MSILGLNELVGKAAINTSFQTGLFNGQRAEMLSQLEFKLDVDEQQAVLGIQAQALSEFAAAIEQLINQREGRHAAAPTERATRPALGWSTLVSSGALFQHG